MTSLLEDDFHLDSPGGLWYARARDGFAAYHGNKNQWMAQARLWLSEPDIGYAEIAWDLVQMEHDAQA